MAADLTTMDKILQDVYLPGVRNHINRKRPIFDRLEKITDKKRFRGRKFVFAHKATETQGVGARAEGATLPLPGNAEILNMELATKYHYAICKVSAQAWSASEGDEGSFASVVDSEVMSAQSQLEEDLALHGIYGMGAGEFGRIAAGGISGTTITMEVTPTVVGMPGSRFLRKDMLYDSFTALTGGAAGGVDLTVSSVNRAASTFVTSANTGLTAGDYIFRDNTRGLVMMGLGGIIDDGTRVATFQGLLRSTYTHLKANVLGNSGTLRAWTPELMDQLAAEGWNNGGGEWPTAFYSRLEIQQRAAAYIRQDRRADMQSMTLDNGYKTVAWTTPDGQKPWFVDQFVRPNELLAIREPDLFLAIGEDVQWEKRGGGRWRFVDRTHQLEAWLFTFRNLGAEQVNNSSVLRDVSETL